MRPRIKKREPADRAKTALELNLERIVVRRGRVANQMMPQQSWVRRENGRYLGSRLPEEPT